MIEKLEQLQAEALERLAAVRDLATLDEWRIAYLGKKGELTLFLRSIGQLPPEERPKADQAARPAWAGSTPAGRFCARFIRSLLRWASRCTPHPTSRPTS
jgi:hypothetical protein